MRLVLGPRLLKPFVLDTTGAWGILLEVGAEVLIVRENVLSGSIISDEWSVVKYSELATVTVVPFIYWPKLQSGRYSVITKVDDGLICNDAQRSVLCVNKGPPFDWMTTLYILSTWRSNSKCLRNSKLVWGGTWNNGGSARHNQRIRHRGLRPFCRYLISYARKWTRYAGLSAQAQIHAI